MCVWGERVNRDGVGEETKGFFRGRGDTREGVGVSAKAPRCRGEAVAQERGFSGLLGEGKQGHSNFIIDFLLRL